MYRPRLGLGRTEIVDYKTDTSRHAEAEYRKQLSVYHHVADSVYPDRTVAASIFYTATGQCQSVDTMSKEALAKVVRTVESGSGRTQ